MLLRGESDEAEFTFCSLTRPSCKEESHALLPLYDPYLLYNLLSTSDCTYMSDFSFSSSFPSSALSLSLSLSSISSLSLMSIHICHYLFAPLSSQPVGILLGKWSPEGETTGANRERKEGARAWQLLHRLIN